MKSPKPTPKALSALQISIADTASDSEASQAAQQLLQHVFGSSGSQGALNDLIAQFWAKKSVGIKSVRVAITSLENAAPKLPKAADSALYSYLFYIRQILENKRHVEHLNGYEWTRLWMAAARVPFDPQRFALVCGCWSSLLDYRHVLPADLAEMVEDLLRVPLNPREQVYDGYLMLCLRQTHDLLTANRDPLAEHVLKYLLEVVAGKTKVKNPLFCREAAVLALRVSASGCSVSVDQAESLIQHLSPYMDIPWSDVSFREEEAQESGLRCIAPHAQADLLPWTATRAVASVAGGRGEADIQDPGRLAKRQKTELSAQVCCFLSEPSVSLGAVAPRHSFWWFVYLGQNVDAQDPGDLADLCNTCVAAHNTEPSGSLFCLARLLRRIVALDIQPGPVLHLLKTLLASIDTCPVTSGSIYLYKTLKSLDILDQELTSLLSTALDPWLASQLSRALESLQMPFSTFMDLIGAPLAIDLSQVKPSRGSFLTYLGICIYTHQQVTAEIPEKLLRTDVESIIELVKTLDTLELSIPAQLASKLAQAVRKTQVDEPLMWRAYYLLERREPTVEQLVYAPIPCDLTETGFKATVSKILGDYRFNRSPEYILRVIEMMVLLERTPAWNELYKFLFATITSQSCFSTLRVPLSRLVSTSSDLRRLFETSTPCDVLLMLESLKTLGDDFSEVLASVNAHKCIRADMLVALAKSGGNMSSIVTELLLEGDRAQLETIGQYYGTTVESMFRDIATKVFLSWSLVRPLQEFPLQYFDNSEALKLLFPLATLSDEWIADKNMFASYYVVGLQDASVEAKLRATMSEKQFAVHVKRNFHQIQLKCWLTARIPPDEFWEGWKAPELVDVWLSEVPEEYFPCAESGDWLMQQIVLAVCRFRQEDLYTAVRQLWALYRKSPVDGSARILLRCCMALVELEASLFPSFEHIFKHLVAEQRVEGPLLGEVLAQYPALVENVDLTELPDGDLWSVLSFSLRGEAVSARLWSGAFADLDDLEFPLYFARFLCERIPPGLEFERDDRESMAARLRHWTQVLNITASDWRAWVGRLVGEFPEQVETKSQNFRTRQLDTVTTFCRRHGYLTNFSVASYLRSLSPIEKRNSISQGSLREKGVRSMVNLMHGPTNKLMDPGISCVELAVQLYEKFASHSLYRAFSLTPELARLLVPYEIVLACGDPATMTQVSKVLDAQLLNPSTEVQDLILDIAAEAYKDGKLLVELQRLIPNCVRLKRGNLGLMFVEVLWGTVGQVSEHLGAVLALVDDPDIHLAQLKVPSLSTLNLSVWDTLSYTLTSNEVDMDTAASLRAMGMFRVANAIERESFYDYRSAWALRQWDLPAAKVPQTRTEVLFNLFRGQELDFPRAYEESWRGGSFSTVFQIETIAAPTWTPDNDLRLAREYWYERQGKFDLLALDLGQSVTRFCEDNNREMALMYARKLERAVRPMDDEAKMFGQTRAAEVAWLLRDQMSAVNMLEGVARDPKFNQASLLQPALVLCTLATWSTEARHASEDVIFDKYLDPATKLASAASDKDVSAHVYHTFARFCDERFKDPELSSELVQARLMRDEQKKVVEEYKEAARTSKDKSLYSKLRRATQLYDLQQKEYGDLEERLHKYLDNSIKFYLKTLQISTSETMCLNASGRFIALWYANSGWPNLERIVDAQLNAVPSYLFIPWVNQLTSRLENKKTGFQRQLSKLVHRLALKHPYHTLWPLLSLTLSGEDNGRSAAACQLWKKSDAALTSRIAQFSARLIALAEVKVKPEDRGSFSFAKVKGGQKWWRDVLKTLQVVSPVQNVPVDPSGRYDAVPYVAQVDTHIAIASGLSAPKIVQFVGSDGKVYTILIKGGHDDLRQDAVMEQVFGHVNVFLRANAGTQKRRLQARTYAVAPLNATTGVIDFVDNTRSLLSVVDPLHAANRDWSQQKARETMHRAFEYGKEARYEAFMEVCRHVRPCLREFFFNEYWDAGEWLAKRTNFSRSTALMSIIGYILGLGDRHCNNILLDVQTGEVVHIDLGIAFDQGKLLRIPETVPFRLTRDIVDGLGITGVSGVFSACAERVLELLRGEQERIMTVLEVLRYDPLYSWRAAAAVGAATGAGAATGGDAEQALFGVKRKLGEKLNAKASVRELVQQATSERNLALIFEGWCPFY